MNSKQVKKVVALVMKQIASYPTADAYAIDSYEQDLYYDVMIAGGYNPAEVDFDRCPRLVALVQGLEIALLGKTAEQLVEGD